MLLNHCHTFIDGDHPVSLHQDPDGGMFIVTYGKQMTGGLSYVDACAEYGQAVFHSLACVSRLNNEGE